MRRIQKTIAPQEFIDFRKNMPGTGFGNLSGEPKNALRKRLLEDQGYICCYCGQRIDDDNTKIEHIKPQKYFPELSLDFNNMLASCDGGEKDRNGGAKKIFMEFTVMQRKGIAPFLFLRLKILTDYFVILQMEQLMVLVKETTLLTY